MINLHDFCGHPALTDSYFHTPWSLEDGRMAASNGHVLIVAEMTANIDEEPVDGDFYRPNVEELLDYYKIDRAENWEPVPRFDYECQCDGSGYLPDSDSYCDCVIADPQPWAGKTIARLYKRIISRLPGVEISTLPGRFWDRPERPIAFRCTGAIGLVCPRIEKG